MQDFKLRLDLACNLLSCDFQPRLRLIEHPPECFYLFYLDNQAML
jgi:hypothetical protein